MPNVLLSNVSTTWTNSGTAYNAIKMNVTDTASAAGSKLIDLQTGGASRFNVDKVGNTTVASAASFSWSARAVVTSPADGILRLTNAAFTDFSRLQFGGTTSAFPSLKRNGTVLQARLADDSGDAGFSAANVTTSTSTANTATIAASGYSVLGTDATPMVDLSGTWNTTGSPTALKLNVVNTASGASANVIDLQVGGTSQFAINKSGVFLNNIRSLNSLYLETQSDGSQQGLSLTPSNFAARSNFTLAWGDSTTGFHGTSTVALTRDATGVLAQRVGTANQTFRVYNTYTDVSNYERASMRWSANSFTLAVENAGTGSPRQLSFTTNFGAIQFNDGNSLMTITSGFLQLGGRSLSNLRNVTFDADNTYDIGTSTTNRPRHIYSANTVNSPAYQLSATGIITEATTARTLSTIDNGKMIYFTNTSAVTVTTANNLGAGFSCGLVQANTGQVTITAGTDTTVNSFASLVKTAGQFAVATVFSPVANNFILAGNLA